MSGTLLLVAAVLAGAACPAHMWWQQRHGRQAACCPPRTAAPDELEQLRERQRQLAAQITERLELHADAHDPTRVRGL